MGYCERYLGCKNRYDSESQDYPEFETFHEPWAWILLILVWYWFPSLWYSEQFKDDLIGVPWLQTRIWTLLGSLFGRADYFDHLFDLLHRPTCGFRMLQTNWKVKAMWLDSQIHENLCGVHHLQHLPEMVPWIQSHTVHLLLFQFKSRPWSERALVEHPQLHLCSPLGNNNLLVHRMDCEIFPLK